MTDLVNKIKAKLCYRKVGTDEFGNDYYVSKKLDAYNKYTRMVIYKGMAEPTKVPPLWHAWLHYNLDYIRLVNENFAWQKPHTPNKTGTSKAYLPSGHPLSHKQRTEPSRGQYKAWRGELN